MRVSNLKKQPPTRSLAILAALLFLVAAQFSAALHTHDAVTATHAECALCTAVEADDAPAGTASAVPSPTVAEHVCPFASPDAAPAFRRFYSSRAPPGSFTT